MGAVPAAGPSMGLENPEPQPVILNNKYERLKMIGKGTFSKVYKACRLEDGKVVAVKIMERRINRISAEREIICHQTLEHPHIVVMLEAFVWNGKLCIAMEYVEGITLQRLLTKVESKILVQEWAKWYFMQMLVIVNYCHARGVCIRDIKLDHFLVEIRSQDPNGRNKTFVKMCDFGAAKMAGKYTNPNTLIGTPGYIPPEMLMKTPLPEDIRWVETVPVQGFKEINTYNGEKADSWALGICLYKMLFGREPFPKPTVEKGAGEFIMSVLGGNLDIPSEQRFENGRIDNVPPETRDLLCQLLKAEPQERLSVTDALNHGWFSEDMRKRAMAMNEKFLSSNHDEIVRERQLPSQEKIGKMLKQVDGDDW